MIAAVLILMALVIILLITVLFYRFGPKPGAGLEEVKAYRKEVLEFEPDPIKAPLPWDENNPPQWRIFNPRGDAALRKCYCHGRLVHVGQKVLLWPDGNAMRIVCEDANLEGGAL